MATLYLLNDFSCALPWNLAAIHANKNALAAKGLEFGPFRPNALDFLPTHWQFWSPGLVDKPVPAWLAQRRDQLQRILDAGSDALLMNAGMHPDGQRFLAQLLTPILSGHKIKPVYVVGAPLCVYEQRWRSAVSIKPEDQILHARRFASWHDILEHARDTYGEIRLIAELSANPRSASNPDLLAKIFQALDRPEFYMPATLPPNSLIFGSDTARRLHNARWTRMNAWPHMDEDKFRQILLSFDEHWGNAPMSPRHLRQMIHEEGKENQAKLEADLELSPGALNPPRWLLEEEQADGMALLDMEKAREFTAWLPLDIARPLFRRLTADPALGLHAQHCLINGLKARPEEEFRHLGEPVPPVAMTVLTMTYNQEKFIAQCMDSVLAQKTDFPVRHLVLDHCSDDNTPKIIAAYAEKHSSIQPILLARHWREENVRGLFLRCKSKYASLCDGDDYFTDPFKLQKQVDFLEKHHRCALVFHPVLVDYEKDPAKNFIYPPMANLPRGVKDEYYLADLFKSNFIQTNSVVYRWRFGDGLPDWFRADLCPSDWYWHLLHAETGKIGFIPVVMSVYRRHGAALYNQGFNDAKAHRKNHGMAELETYKAVDEHFHGRYFRELAALANGVFVNFLELSMNGDNSLLDQACDKYPKFGANFLANLKIGGGKKEHA